MGFSRILIANRGEIAVRIARACRDLGIATVAVYSDADSTAPQVLVADEAVSIGPAEPAASYLSIDRILQAARRTGADAVHPGYGFLSENAAFARACREARIVFIGPPADVIAALGDKSRARGIAIEAGVPVVPGHDEPSGDDDLARAAERIGFPVLLKAAAGGGGKGMRVVHAASDLPDALASARREARSAFGDDALILERYFEGARHIEIQILADGHGNAVHLGERECSVQRRYQKIVEEAPSVAVDAALRASLGEAALRVGRAAGYVNVGTVEFLVDCDRRFYFLEVNTRLQVEHPVTEAVTGIDMVHEQIRIAAGHRLGVAQHDVALRGHAVECRVYAEDPEADFAPSPGTVLRLFEPHIPGVRIDSGIRAGQTIPVHYDPILAKIIAWGPDRDRALARMTQALSEYVILGIQTNIPHLRAIVTHPSFVAGELSTDFLSRHLHDWRRSPPSPEAIAVAAALLAERQTHAAERRSPTAVPDPWDRLHRWRMV
jgi:acetyl-CoA/propionyl-CoA carboxylase biotin carboxyl carrier protein